MVNSCLGFVTATLFQEYPFSRSYGVILPSSLTRVLSRALGFSPHPPVSVCGTGSFFLSRDFSWQLASTASVLDFPPHHAFGLTDGFPYLSPILACTYSSNRTLCLALCVIPSIHASKGGTGISTSCPSPTPSGLGLGPGLPWADEPSPGILRLPAGRILTCLIVYLYRHSLFCTLHVSFPSRFSGYRTLLYQLTFVNSASSVHCLSPVTFSAQNPWTSELLRTLLMVAASEPTSWLFSKFHILRHLVRHWGP